MVLKKMSPDTVGYQKKLADYCRSGTSVDIPGITPNRLHHYRRLVSNVIYDALEKAFPITYRLLSDEEWESAIDDFFTNHDCRSPQIWKMPREFYVFLKNNGYPKKLGKSYLGDLLHFEWVEIEIHCMPDVKIPKFKAVKNYLNDVFVFNPEHQILGLTYPVHLTIDPEKISKEGKYFVLIYRDYEVRNVHFINLGYVPAICISLMVDECIPLISAIEKAEYVLGIKVTDAQSNNLVNLFKSLEYQGFLLGAQVLNKD